MLPYGGLRPFLPHHRVRASASDRGSTGEYARYTSEAKRPAAGPDLFV